MDIDLLSKMVKELILDEDKVVLPGLGCFVAEIVPASFSDKGYTINPPYRRLYFRSRPDEGTTLVDFYARSNGVEYEVAERIITDFLSELKSIIYVRKTVVFPGLGRLRATKENNLFFIADEDLDIFPDGFGLAPVSLKTHQETKEEVAAAVVDLKNILDDTSVSQSAEDSVPVVIEASEEQSEIVQDESIEDPEEPIFEPIVESEAQSEPQSEPQSKPQPQSDPEPDPEPEPEAVHAQEMEVYEPTVANNKKRRNILRILKILLVLIVILLAVYMLAGRLCPEIVDQFLYSPEELEILNK